MNKARRVSRGRGRRPFRRIPGLRNTAAVTGNLEKLWPDQDAAEMERATGGVCPSKLSNRSVKSEAIEDYAIYSIHLSEEAVTSSKIAQEAILPSHLAFNSIRGITGESVLQQVGESSFEFQKEEDVVEIPVVFQESYPSVNYVMLATANDPFFQTGVIQREDYYAVIRIIRPAGYSTSEGSVSWLAAGAH